MYSNCGYLEFPHDPPSGLTAWARDQMLAELSDRRRGA
jgi:hypothetical protein